MRAKVAPDQRKTLEAVVERYYGQVDPEDLAERQPADLYGAALSHWNFARKREPGQARVRVFNPTLEEHGWQSTHTIIEIVNDDMPFLVDSVTMEVNRHGLTLHLIIHPLILVDRDADGTLQGLGNDGAPTARRESFIHVEIDRITDAARHEALAADVIRVLDDVRVAVADWKGMQAKVLEVVADLEKRPPPIPAEQLEEGLAFLRWLADNHLTLLGYRRHELVTVGGQDALKIVPGSSLGLLREGATKEVSASFAALPPEVRAYARRPELLVITKSTARSTVHRPGYLDYIAVKRFDAAGNVTGEDRFLGLYTSTAYSANPADIPLLRRKTANVVARSGVAPGSHAGKALINILANYPRDELFQITEDELLQTAMAILHLGERQRFRLFVRRDPFERFLSCLIYAPRENFSTALRRKWQAILTAAFNGSSSEFNVHLSESMLARIQITVRTTPGKIPEFDVRELEARLVASARRWDDDLKDALLEALGEARGNELLRRFGDAFPAGYRDEVAARSAVPDIEMMAKLSRRPAARHVAVPAAGGPARHAALQDLPPGRAGDAVRQPADAGAHGVEGAGRASAPRDAGGRQPDLDPRLRHDGGRPRHRSRGRRAASGLRGCVRPHFPRRSRERRLQPAGRCRAHAGRRDRRAARLCKIHAPDRLSAVAGVHRGHAGGACGRRRRARGAVQDALRSRRRAQAQVRARQNSSARSRRCWSRSTTCRKTACFASISR